MTVKQMWQRCVKHSLVVLGHSQTGAGPLSFGRLGQRSNVSFIVALLVMCAVQHAGAAILFEDYRGTNASPTAVSTVPTVPADYYVNGPEPAAPNGFVPLDNLRALSSDPTNAINGPGGTVSTTGNIDFAPATLTLCNNDLSKGGNVTSPSCLSHAMGRVIYARIRFPNSGNYTIRATHDDQVQVDLSSQYTNTDFRNALYNIPAARMASYSDDATNGGQALNVGQVVGTYNSPGANTCALIRVYWNNTNGYNHLRLWWGTSGSPSIIPASALFDPSVQPAAGTCTQSISSTSPSITLTKNVASRAPGDQFTIQIADDPSGSSVKKQGTTSGTGLGDQESIALVATAGSTYYLRDVPSNAAGIAAYTPTIICTGGNSPTLVSPGVWSIVPTGSNQLACTITNTAKTYTVGATVTGTGGTVSCTPTTVYYGQSAQCTAVPNAGYSFAAWTGNCAGQSATCSLSNIAANKLSQASFAANGTLTVTKTLTGTTFAAATSYNFSVSCQTPTATYTGSVGVAAGASTGSSGVSIPAGSTACTVAEDIATRPAAPTNYNWGAPIYSQPAAAAMPPGGSVVAGITNPLIKNTTLSLGKSGPASAVASGDSFDYTLTVTNSGQVASAAGVVVRDQLPAGMVATGPASCAPLNTAGALLSCTLASAVAPNGGTTTITLTVKAPTVNSSTSVINYASIGPAGGTPPAPGTGCTTANCGSATTTVTPKAGLRIVKSANPNGTYVPGQPLNYQIVVTNSGPSAAVGAVVSDTVPNTVTVSSWSCAASAGSSCTAVGSGNTINDTVTIPAGGSLTYTITGTATNTATGDIVNTASVTPPAGVVCAPSCTLSSTTTNTNTGTPKLSITKQATPNAFAVGSPGSYSLLVSNSVAVGSSSTSGVITVSDTLPAGITASGAASGTGWSCSVSGSTITCTTSTVLPPGVSAPVITVPVTVGAAAANPSINTVTVGGGGDLVCTQPPASPVPAQCQGTSSTTVNAPKLDLLKTLGGALVVGQPQTYTIVVTNNGQAATSAAATVVDNIPAGLVISTPLPGACTASGQAVSCTIPSGLGMGSQASFAVTVTPDASVQGQQVSNTASVSGGGDPTCTVPPAASLAAHCQGTTTGTVSAPQLLLGKTASPTSFAVGQAGSYTLTVTNQGTAATSGTTTVTDTVPTGLTIGTLPAGCTAAGQQVSCTTTQSLAAANGTTSFTIPVTAQAAVDGMTVQNAATVTGGGDPGCSASTSPLPARCQAQVPVVVVAPALKIDKSASTTAFAIGVAASYTLKVTNVGTTPTDGTSWTVSDIVPGGLTISTPLPAGCTATGQQVTCTSTDVLAAGNTTGKSFVIGVTPTAAAVPSVTNTATVQGGGDPHCPAANNANCSSSITTTVTAEADMAASSPVTLATTVGVPTSITTTCTNNGPNNAVNATCVVTGVPPAANPVTTCTPASPVGVLSQGLSISCTTTFTPVDTTPITITTTGASSTKDPDPSNDVAKTDTTAVTQGSVTVKKALNASTVSPVVGGQAIVYDLEASNAGGTAVANHTFFEVVPTNTTFSGSITGATTDCVAGATAGNVCTVTLANVPANGLAKATITFTAVASIPVGVTSIANLITNDTKTAPPGCPIPMNKSEVFIKAGTTPVCPQPLASTCDAASQAYGHCVQTPATPSAQPPADMVASAPQLVHLTPGAPMSVTSVCVNNGPSVAQNASCVVTGAPAGAVTTCTSASPVASLAVGAMISCTTTFTPANATTITLTTTAASNTPDSNPANNVAQTAIQAASVQGVPVNSWWVLAMLSVLMLWGGVVSRHKRH